MLFTTLTNVVKSKVEKYFISDTIQEVKITFDDEGDMNSVSVYMNVNNVENLIKQLRKAKRTKMRGRY